MPWSLLWTAWTLASLAGFLVIEIPAVRRTLPGPDTLTDHVRWLFALDSRPHPCKVLRRIAFLYLSVGSAAVAVGHFVGWL